jgi:class 3 adenylate cyclase
MTTPKPEDMIHANIAIVLTDIIGSTKFVQRVGAETAAIRFSQHDRLVLTLISTHNGQWVDNSDGHLMFFNTVQDAIAFAFAYKRRLREIGFPFRSRVGIHWDSMIILKTSERLVRGGVKRINIEGLGKNIAARTMSLCGPEQILLSHNAYLQFKSRLKNHRDIPAKALCALVGLYKFKGVTNPERIYALGLETAHIQPPPDSEKARRLGGAKKIKTRLKHKKLKELILWFFWRLSIILWILLIIYLWPFLSSEHKKRYWNLDYELLIIFEYIDYILRATIHFILKGF